MTSSRQAPVQPATSSRRYDASGRRAQALVTRERILERARELFVERGFAGVSVAEIARESGVSVPTVFARFGSKVTLLKEAVETALVGDAAPVPFAHRPEMQHVMAGGTAEEVVERYAAVVASLGSRVAPIAMVMYAAADSDPDIAELAQRFDEQRHTGATALARSIAGKPGGADAAVTELADQLWLANAPQTYDLFVRRRRWSSEHYRRWLVRTLTPALVPLARQR